MSLQAHGNVGESDVVDPAPRLRFAQVSDDILLSVFPDSLSTCGATRGEKGKIRCEMPKDHILGRAREPFWERSHLGRSRTGRWYSWEDK